jgi:hypothetical protein
MTLVIDVGGRCCGERHGFDHAGIRRQLGQPQCDLSNPTRRPSEEAEPGSLGAGDHCGPDQPGWEDDCEWPRPSTHDHELDNVAEDRNDEANDEAQRLEPRLLITQREAEPSEDAQDVVNCALLKPRGAQHADPSHRVRDSLSLVGDESRQVVQVG